MRERERTREEQRKQCNPVCCERLPLLWQPPNAPGDFCGLAKWMSHKWMSCKWIICVRNVMLLICGRCVILDTGTAELVTGTAELVTEKWHFPFEVLADVMPCVGPVQCNVKTK